ncbi:DUF1889 family protein [Shewanella chilikensis]|jgi:hypothetical protein|uniref:DUF1889 family protein n=1 Tax=Shewanella chilikensis TaxID=558541 RepID=UPI001F319398|nr:DUF1889 family protein [Shewanella chilikensis]MCE9853269.1 DUF1889 family protein [Shewanella chilikensis]
MTPLVEEALKSLTIMVNLSTGIIHPSDESAAKEYFKALYKEGEPLIGSEITNWASANGWQPKHAKELGALAEKIGSGGRVVIKNKGMLRPNIIEILKEKVATNA